MDKTIKETIIQTATANEYMRNLGLEFIIIEPDHIKGKIDIKPSVLNPYGSVHGGALYSLADIIAGFTACTRGKFVSTVNGNMTFLKPAMNTSHIYCDANIVHAGRKIITVAVSLYNDDDILIENGTFIFSILENKVFKNE